MIAAASTSETTVNLYQTTRRNNPEDSHLDTHRREKLKSHKIVGSHFNSANQWTGSDIT
jgi:hypothetical protein